MFRQTGLRVVVVVGAIFVLATTTLGAQSTAGQPTAADVAAELRQSASSGVADKVLARVRGNRSIRDLDEIADTLAAIAISLRGVDAKSSRVRFEAVSALRRAAIADSAVLGSSRAVAFAGAIPRLMRIVIEAETFEAQSSALWSLAQLPDQRSVIPFLRQQATLERQTAWVAVKLLCEQSTAEATAAAKALLVEGRVSQRAAQELLRRCASAKGWTLSIPNGRR